jgi:hypothetical protein
MFIVGEKDAESADQYWNKRASRAVKSDFF